MKIKESKLEDLSVSWFQDTGWIYAHGPDIAPEGAAPERSDFRVVILKNRLASAISRLNPKLPPAAVEEVIQLASKPGEPSLAQNNRAFHRLLLGGVPIDFANAEGEPDSDVARLIDFQNPANNDFLVVNQFTVTGTKQPRRPDLVAFVNGLPLFDIELKNPADENTDIWEAFDQIQTYKDEISDLYIFNEALVVSDGTNARIGSLTASQEWFMPWRTIANEDDKPQLEYQLETLIRGFFNPAYLLDYLRYFVLFEQDGDRLIKKIAGYHQFHGVREAVRVTLIAAREQDEERQGQGTPRDLWRGSSSGLQEGRRLLAHPGIGQEHLHGLLRRHAAATAGDEQPDPGGGHRPQRPRRPALPAVLLRQGPAQARPGAGRQPRGAAPEAGRAPSPAASSSPRSRSSPCPRARSATRPCATATTWWSSPTRPTAANTVSAPGSTSSRARYKFGYAKHMRDALPNASFIGFTGTPIELEDKDTRGTFGDYVSIYDIQDAVDDGATVEIFYESRLAKLDINRAEIDALNQEVEEVIEDEEDIAAREKTKGKWTELAKLVGAEERIKEVAADLIGHFETRTESLDGKAMIVCMSRDICVSLFDEIIALRPDWAGTRRKRKGQDIGYNPEDGAIRIVMTGNATDRKALQDHVYTKQEKKRLEKRFKDPADPLKLVIVRDMWLTGFDAPCCHTMYVDKPMRGHNLAQSIARVNRVFKDKPGGLIVDYIGIAGDLKRAVKTYTDAKGKGQPTVKAQDALVILLEKMDVVRGLFASNGGFDYSAYKNEPLQVLIPAANHILGLDDGKKRYADVMASVTKSYSLCSTLDEAAALREEIAFFSAVRAVIIKDSATKSKFSQKTKDSVLKQILDNAVLSEGVVDVFDLAGLEKPNISLLSEEFLEDVKRLPQRNLAVELLERLLRDQIRSRARTNVVQEKKYSDRLLETLRKYHNRSIETAKVIEELVAMALDIQDALKRDEELGLSQDEVAFYDALAEKPEVLKEMGSDTLKSLATELTEKLRKSTSVDWQVRESVRAKMRLLIKRLLRKYKYPPAGQEAAVARVIEQAEALADSWTS